MEKKPYITERVYVETPVDTDGDGKKDLIAVYLRLPRDLREGERIPGNIYCQSVYADLQRGLVCSARCQLCSTGVRGAGHQGGGYPL